jgi:hypothetical protein
MIRGAVVPDADSSGQNRYHETSKCAALIRSTDSGNTETPDRTDVVVLIELVVVEGPEGERLHELQSAAVRAVLQRIAEGRARVGTEGEAGP